MLATFKQFRARLADHCDELVIGNTQRGFRVRRSYFYRCGLTAETFAAAVAAIVGPEFQLIDAVDDWAAWPRTSYFSAYFRPAAPVATGDIT